VLTLVNIDDYVTEVCMCVWQISAGRTHSAAWTCPAPVRRSHGTTSTLQLGTPSSVPAQYTSLHDCSIEDIKARLQLLHHYSDLVYSSWRLLSLVPSHVSTLHIYIKCIAVVALKLISFFVTSWRAFGQIASVLQKVLP